MNKRLETIVSLIDPKDCVVDIGTDHALLPNALVAKGATCVYATEVAQGPYYIAQKNKHPNVKLELHDGLVGFEHEIDVIVIAGMGGELIAKILRASIQKAKSAKKIILQPMTRCLELRRALIDMGFVLAQEILVEESLRYYEIYVCEVGEEIDYDPHFFKKTPSPSASYEAYLRQQLETLEQHLQHHVSKRLDTRAAQLRKKLGEL